MKSRRASRKFAVIEAVVEAQNGINKAQQELSEAQVRLRGAQAQMQVALQTMLEEDPASIPPPPKSDSGIVARTVGFPSANPEIFSRYVRNLIENCKDAVEARRIRNIIEAGAESGPGVCPPALAEKLLKELP